MVVNTKQNILESARKKFNETGYFESSMRSIANETGISVGNLNYHYSKKSDILESLYATMRKSFDRIVLVYDHQPLTLELFYNTTIEKNEVMYNYRFFYRELYKILTEFPMINYDFAVFQQNNTLGFIDIINKAIKSGLVRLAVIENEYERLYLRINAIYDSWANSVHLMRYRDDLIYISNLIFESLFPYLTEEGRIEYYNLLNK